ncbi:RNA-binding protein [Mycena venus]|uniref:RNA-binding protein n=1 Tax=Mycena venus TaxID=2733690 RepID=A0A8H6XG56_9AGAR|nr:RNA-binding protein [Mycena venus]
MNPALENSINSPTDNNPSAEERKQSPPAFLDLADSAARLGSNMPDMSARVELKRLEHERQRLLQRKIFEDQMRALEQQQAQELLSLPYDANAPSANGGMGHLAVSAPTTPPRVNAVLNGEPHPAPKRRSQNFDAETLSKAVGTAVSDKRKSVTYAPSVNLSPDLNTGSAANSSFSRAAGAKSMPASRRTSASEHDEELAGHLQGLSMAGERASPGPVPVTASILTRGSSRYADDEGARYASTYNAGMMLDEQLDQEMHNAMRNLPTSDDDKYTSFLLLLPLWTWPTFLRRLLVLRSLPVLSRLATSRQEWPQFAGSTRAPPPEGVALRADRRTVTNPNLTLSAPSNDASGKLNTVSASATPLVQQHPQLGSHATHAQLPTSRRGSPPSLLESLNATTRSVPATPLGIPNSAVHILKSPGTPHTPETQALNGRLASVGESAVNAGDLQASLSRLPSGQYDSGSLTFNSIQGGGLDDTLQQQYGGGMDSVYGLNGDGYNSYGFESGGRGGVNSTGTGSTALYHHNGSRYGLGLPARTNSGAGDGKMNGLHGPKHKRGDMDREFNRFAGTRLEDLQGEIPALCKDQHGCRYLQKKLEEGSAEHRDMIFRETFGHFADLMTDPFGNYLCQKLLEYSTDEQRNVICDSVAQDLVNISLNMHGTRAVQKMIDFLSTRRQASADARYNAQIHSIIVALSLHVVVLIKDLNGNHVIQKCLNKLAPEDNQACFIYNAVAANCVEVATHRHGCCVLQRCIDHASDHQRIQLVNEITFNALTLVQDPYGNYVVQYILDLNDNRFSDAVIRQFTGNVCALSVQKFSSNVIEKCVRVAEHNTRKMLIEELLNRTRLEKLLRDSYGNYCVQTALDYAEPTQRALLVEGHPACSPAHSEHAVRGGLYAQSSFGQTHMAPQHHSLGQSIDGYVLQGNSSHIGLGSSHHAGGLSGAPFAGISPFGGAGLTSALSGDPYQRSFGYGM